MKIPKKNYRKHQTFIYDISEIEKEIKQVEKEKNV